VNCWRFSSTGISVTQSVSSILVAKSDIIQKDACGASTPPSNGNSQINQSSTTNTFICANYCNILKLYTAAREAGEMELGMKE